jgi:O-antigen/teichoic acid export membrane protein
MTPRRPIRRLLKATGGVAAGASVANALAYVLTVIAARALTPAEFGAFSALLALIIVGNVAALAIQATVAREIARRAETGDTVVSGLVIAGVVGAALLAAAPAVTAFLSLSSAGAAVAAAAAITAMAATGPALGTIQGNERFHALGAAVGGQAALRVAGGLVGLAVSPTAASALAGMAIGVTVAGVGTWLLARPPLKGGVGIRPAFLTTLGAGGLLLGFVVMTNADVVLARHVLTAEDSGFYGVGAIFTKIAFWLPQFVPLMAFPALADPDRRKGAMRLGLLAVAGCGAVLVAATALFARPAVTAVAGSQYEGLATWVPGFTALGAIFAIAQLLVYAHLAAGDRPTTAVVWIVLVAYIIVVEMTATTVLGVLAPALAAATIVCLWGFGRERTSRARPESAPTLM